MLNSQVDATVAAGFKALGENRLKEALAFFQNVVAQAPDRSDILQGLGLTLKSLGDIEGGITQLSKAVSRYPHDVAARLNLGSMLLDAGRAAEAISSFEDVLRRKPGWPIAVRNLGIALLALGEATQARELLSKAIAATPRDPGLHFQLGNAFLRLSAFPDAVAAFSRACALDPNDADAAYNLGWARAALDLHDQAILDLQCSLHLRPHNPQAMVALASSLLVLSRQQEALALLHRAKTLAPADPEIYVTLGFALRSVRDLPGAEAAWQRALELDPECSAAQVNQAMTRAEAGDLDEAARLLDAALAREPGLSRAGVAKAYLHLLRGDFESGWQQLERRLELPVASMKPKAPPRWQGEPLLGHRILVEAEEGFGDTLQFVRYLPLLMAQGAKVTLRAPKPLLKLLRQSFRDVIVVAEGEAAPHADVRIELLSLPLRFGTRLDSIPREIPYLSVGQEALARWQAILGEDNGLRVGVVWAGNPRQTNDCNRSMPVEYLGTLAAIPGVTLYSLMVGPRGRDLARLSLNTVIDLTPRLSDFSETAAAISVLDLVVTVCTSAAHLTGALGRPGYVLLSTAADWRWLRERADSPWYPSLKLIRQITPGDWSAPIATIAGHLRDHAGQHKV